MINQQILWIRRVILLLFIGVFLILSGLFLKQLQQNNRVQSSLEAAYSYSLSNSKGIDNLYHAFSEADMTFRMFTLSFDPKIFESYQSKMDSVYLIIDSLNDLSNQQDTNSKTDIDFQARNKYLEEFKQLRINLDSLLTQSEKTNIELQNQATVVRKRSIQTDSILQDIIKENVTTSKADTVITKREGLFKRIFNPSQDTIVVNSKNTEKLNERLVGIIQEGNHAPASTQLPKNNSNDLGNIRNTIRHLQSKEEQLIVNTYEILNAIKTSIDHLKHLEISDLRHIESQDFGIYRKNAQDINRQFILGLSLMAILIIILIYNQWYARRMEKKLLHEVQYSNHIAKEKTEVLASISHEVRTPLNSLLSISNILKNDPMFADNSEKKVLLDSVFNNIESTSNTINDILALSKLEEKEGTPYSNPDNWHEFNLKKCLEYTVNLHQNPAELKSIKLIEVYEGIDNLSIKSDPFPIKQAISNFLSNAIKHTPTGGKITLKTQFVVKKQDNKGLLIVNIEDTGTGIPKENQQHVFRKYFSSRDTTGFGLGLYISQKLIQGLNGKIGFVSEFGKGSTFYIQVPVDHFNFEKQPVENTPIIMNAIADTFEKHPSLHVLSVDDNPINLLFIRHFFKNSSHTIIEANSIAQAKDHLQSTKIDVIITDINLPDGTGWDLLELIRTDNKYKELRIIATSASNEALEKSSDLKISWSFDDTLPKPFSEQTLWTTLARVVAKG